MEKNIIHINKFLSSVYSRKSLKKQQTSGKIFNHLGVLSLYIIGLLMTLFSFNNVNGQACKPVISVTGTLDPCDNTSFVTLTAIATGSSSTAYIWTGGSTNSTLNASTAGTYTVTVTYNVGGATCSGTASITIAGAYNHLTVTGPRSQCRIGSALYTITAGPPGASYNWAILNGISSLSSSTGAAVTVTFSGGGTAIFTISYTEGTCNRVETLYVYSCCDAGFGNITINDTRTSLLTPTYLTSPGVPVTINGVLEVDANYTISGCAIGMAPGSQIVVDHGVTLTITNYSHLYGGCNQMWKGILVNHGGAVRFADGSILEDAEVGIDLQSTTTDPCDLELTSGTGTTYNPCLLQDNYIDLRAINNFTMSVGPISHATFGFSGTFLTSYAGQQLVPTNKPYAAIVFEDAPNALGFIGNNTGSFEPITIEDHATGIYAQRSSFDVVNTVFQDINTGTSYGAFPGTQNGWGIYAESYNDQSCTVLGLGNTVGSPITFNRCKGGIEARSMTTDIESCIFDDCEYGIYTRLTQSPSTMYVYNNVINCTHASNALYGVFSRYSGTAGIYILYNEVNINASSSGTVDRIGIYQNDVVAADNTGTQIYWNRPVNLLNYAHDGIQLESVRGSNVEENIVYCDQTTYTLDANCFNFQNADDTYITLNNANDATISTYQAFANSYLTERSTGWTYECNNSYVTRYGFRFNKNCNSPQGFKGNYMSDNHYGLYIEDNSSGGTTGKIGAQTQMGNKWNLSPTHHAIFDAALVVSPSFASGSPFTVHQTTSTTFNPVTKTMVFTVNTNGSPYECSNNFTGRNPEENDYLADVNEAIGLNNGGDASFDNWYNNRTLYADLDKYPALINSNGALAAYYNSLSNAPIGQLYAAGKVYRSYQNEFASINLSFRYNDSTARVAARLVMANNQAIHSGTLSESDSLALVSENANLNTAIETATQNKAQLDRDAQWYHDSNIQNATAMIASVNPVLLFDVNEKAVMDIYLRTVARDIDIFNAADANTLLTIAQQCVNYGGMAVYDARSLYKLIDPSAHFSDDGCDQLGQRKMDRLKNTDGIMLIPNPANDKVSVIFQGYDVNEKPVAEIYSLTGTMVSHTPLTSSNNILDVGMLSNGFYMVKIKSQSNISMHKLQIIK